MGSKQELSEEDLAARLVNVKGNPFDGLLKTFAGRGKQLIKLFRSAGAMAARFPIPSWYRRDSFLLSFANCLFHR